MNKKLLTLLVLLGVGISTVGCGNKNNSTPTQSSSSSSSAEVCTTEEDNKVHLVLLTGQSGARGKALNGDLSDIKVVSADEALNTIYSSVAELAEIELAMAEETVEDIAEELMAN